MKAIFAKTLPPKDTIPCYEILCSIVAMRSWKDLTVRPGCPLLIPDCLGVNAISSRGCHRPVRTEAAEFGTAIVLVVISSRWCRLTPVGQLLHSPHDTH